MNRGLKLTEVTKMYSFKQYILNIPIKTIQFSKVIGIHMG